MPGIDAWRRDAPVVLFANPTAQSGRAREQIRVAEELLTRAGVPHRFTHTEPEGGTVAVVARAIDEDGARVVIAMGGDGTIHILWVNLVTDGLPGLALALEPEERGVMRRPPRHPAESIFAHGLWQHALWVGLLMGGVTLATQAWALGAGSADWQSITFTVLTLSQMGHLLAIRSERESLFMQGVWSNPWLVAAVALTFILQMGTLYVPAFAVVLKTQPLSGGELALCLVASTIVFVAVEIEKWMTRRGWLYREDRR